jgi:hypothetical protein
MNITNLNNALSKPKSPAIVLGLFTLFGLIVISQHAFWRDEVNPWLIARDSSTWAELWENIRYEGHPLIWYLCLVVLNYFTHSLFSMQLLHIAIGISAVAIFWFYSPFKPLEKLLFTFGYFPFYDYFIISRNYVFGMLGSFLFCALYPCRKSTYLPLAIVLGVMANTHAYALFFAIFFGLVLLLEFIFDTQHRQNYLRQSRFFDLILSIIIFLGLTLFAASMISPPTDSQLHGGNTFFLDFDFHRLLWAIGRISGAYLIIIPNSSKWLDLILLDSLILGIVTVIIIKFSNKPLILFFYTFSTFFTTFIFFYGKNLKGSRHFGVLYLILICSLWLASYYQENLRFSQFFNIPPNFIQRANKVFPWIFGTILTVHMVTGDIRELVLPWSASRATAQYIQESELNREFIVGSRDANMAPLAGYLKRKIYYPQIENFGSFTLFKSSRYEVDNNIVFKQITEILKGDRLLEGDIPSRILLILNSELDVTEMSNQLTELQLTSLKEFKRSCNEDETYYLYWVKLKSLQNA